MGACTVMARVVAVTPGSTRSSIGRCQERSGRVAPQRRNHGSTARRETATASAPARVPATRRVENMDTLLLNASARPRDLCPYVLGQGAGNTQTSPTRERSAHELESSDRVPH